MKIKLDRGAYMPIRAYETDAGLDLLTPISVTVPARGSATINTGVHVELPINTTGFLKSKSGLNVKHGLTSEGVIDYGYSGSIVAKIYNNTDTDYTFKARDKITQLVILPIIIPDLELVNELESEYEDKGRGDNGFGSSGY